jgi:hypothetical protein
MSNDDVNQMFELRRQMSIRDTVLRCQVGQDTELICDRLRDVMNCRRLHMVEDADITCQTLSTTVH